MTDEVPLPSEDDVLGYFETLSNWGRWGPDDERGTLNHITPEHRRRAATLVSEGVTVSCAREIDTTPGPFDRYGPPQRFMTSTGQPFADPDRVPAGPGLRERRYFGASEYIGMVFHGHRVTHLDALSHQHWDRRMYNGAPGELVHSLHGATRNAVTAAGDGIVTRGVLLDIPALHGKEWLDPDTPIHIADLEAAEARQGVRVGQGDVLMVRIGYGRRIRERGPLDPLKHGEAGLHAACLPWLHERSIAVLGSDGGSDLRPSGYAQVWQPSHNIGIFAMGLWLIDNMDLEDLAAVATRLSRWEFLFALAPLRFSGATGSPANPLAVF